MGLTLVLETRETERDREKRRGTCAFQFSLSPAWGSWREHPGVGQQQLQGEACVHDGGPGPQSPREGEKICLVYKIHVHDMTWHEAD